MVQTPSGTGTLLSYVTHLCTLPRISGQEGSPRYQIPLLLLPAAPGSPGSPAPGTLSLPPALSEGSPPRLSHPLPLYYRLPRALSQSPRRTSPSLLSPATPCAVALGAPVTEEQLALSLWSSAPKGQDRASWLPHLSHYKFISPSDGPPAHTATPLSS